MLNPFLNLHDPTPDYRDLDEEQFAQQHGQLVALPTLRERVALRLGKLFIMLGEQLTHEDPCRDLTREAA